MDITVSVAQQAVEDAAYLGVELKQQFLDVVQANALRAADRRCSELRENVQKLPGDKQVELLDLFCATVQSEIENHK